MGVKMEKYIFYYTDECFDYGDYSGSTCYIYEPHGFEVAIEDNKIDLSTIKGLGEFEDEVKKIKTLDDLNKFIYKNKKLLHPQGKEPCYIVREPLCEPDNTLLRLNFLQDLIEAKA